jgi:hypothetical protein
LTEHTISFQKGQQEEELADPYNMLIYAIRTPGMRIMQKIILKLQEEFNKQLGV